MASRLTKRDDEPNKLLTMAPKARAFATKTRALARLMTLPPLSSVKVAPLKDMPINIDKLLEQSRALATKGLTMTGDFRCVTTRQGILHNETEEYQKNLDTRISASYNRLKKLKAKIDIDDEDIQRKMMTRGHYVRHLIEEGLIKEQELAKPLQGELSQQPWEKMPRWEIMGGIGESGQLELKFQQEEERIAEDGGITAFFRSLDGPACQEPDQQLHDSMVAFHSKVKDLNPTIEGSVGFDQRTMASLFLKRTLKGAKVELKAPDNTEDFDLARKMSFRDTDRKMSFRKGAKVELKAPDNTEDFDLARKMSFRETDKKLTKS